MFTSLYTHAHTHTLSPTPNTLVPHQPRLDWQMWFAALGHHQNNPWLVHMVRKLLLGQPEGEYNVQCIYPRMLYLYGHMWQM